MAQPRVVTPNHEPTLVTQLQLRVGSLDEQWSTKPTSWGTFSEEGALLIMEHGLSQLILEAKPGTAFSLFWDVGKSLNRSKSPFPLLGGRDMPSIPAAQGHSKAPLNGMTFKSVLKSIENHTKARVRPLPPLRGAEGRQLNTIQVSGLVFRGRSPLPRK